MNSHGRLVVALAGLVLAGCGGESASSSAKPVSEEDRAGEVTLRYVRAVADKDWRAACATRTDQEQREMARLGGSCEKAFAAIFKGKPTDLFADVELGDVRVKGTRAEVEVVQPGQSEPAATFVATKAGDDWRLLDE